MDDHTQNGRPNGSSAERHVILRAWALLDGDGRLKAVLVVCGLVTATLLDMIGVAALFPFLQIVSDPSSIHDIGALDRLHAVAGRPGEARFVAYVGLVCAVLFVIGTTMRVAGQALVIWFAQDQRAVLSRQLLSSFLALPYEEHLRRHSSNMTRQMLSEVDEVVSALFLSLWNIFAQSATIVAMLVVMLFVDVGVTILALGSVAATYLLVYAVVAPKARRLGAERAQHNALRFGLSNEALTGIKLVKFKNLEDAYLERYGAAAQAMARNVRVAEILGIFPRYLIEAVAFVVIVSSSVIYLLRGGDLASALPTLGVFVLAGYRLLPAAQIIFQSLARLRFGIAAIATIEEDVLALRDEPARDVGTPARALTLESGLSLEDVTYRYAVDERPRIEGIDLIVRPSETIGIMGGTGAGKSTLVDVLLGLLVPQEGVIRVDGKALGTQVAVRDWQASVGYVPQEIFLVDASVRENIAFGVDPAAIDIARLRDVARMVRLLDLIETDLPDGFDTTVGERGARLSGGQKQRLGLARALYQDPAMLVLDEATSALDPGVELEVMDTLRRDRRDRATIMVAHRLTTLRHCDRVHVVEDGRIVASGPFDVLAAGDPAFARVAGRGAPHVREDAT